MNRFENIITSKIKSSYYLDFEFLKMRNYLEALDEKLLKIKTGKAYLT